MCNEARGCWTLLTKDWQKDLLLRSVFIAVWGQDRYDLGRLAQWLERLLHTQEVTGSSPVPPTIDTDRAAA